MDMTGAINLGSDIVTANGNFSATGTSFSAHNPNRTVINTGTGNLTITANSTAHLGNITTNNLTINADGDLTDQSIQAGNVAVRQEAGTKLIVNGIATFNTHVANVDNTNLGGDITLDNSTNEFKGTILFTKTGSVSLTDSTAINLGTSDVFGNLTLTGDGITQTTGSTPSFLSVTGTTTLNANNKAITLANSNNNFGGALSVTKASVVTLRDKDDIRLEWITLASGSTGNLDITAGTNNKIILSGTIDTTAGTEKNITLRNSVDLEGAAALNAGSGLININGAINSVSTAQNLTLTGKDIFVKGNLGNEMTLGAIDIVSTGNVEFKSGNTKHDIVANSLAVSGATSFIANDIITGGGVVDVTAANTIDIGTVNTSAATAGAITLTANGTADKIINVNGDLIANHSAPATGQALIKVELANTAGAGTINFNHSSFLTSNVNASGLGAADTIKLTNTANTWVTTAANSGAVKNSADLAASPIITFDGFETLTGGTQTDDFTIVHNISTAINGGNGNDKFAINVASLDAVVNGGAGADEFTINAATTKLTLNGDAGADIFNVVSAGAVTATLNGGNDADPLIKDTLNAAARENSWLLGGETEFLNKTEVLQGIQFSGIENVNGNSEKDTFSVGARAVSGTIDAGGVSATDINDEVTVATDAEINLSSGASPLSSVKNAEVLHSTGGGTLTVLSSESDTINWIFAATNSVERAATQTTPAGTPVKFSGFTSYLGDDGKDIFSIQNTTPFQGLLDGGGGINEFGISQLVDAQTLAVNDNYNSAYFANLNRFQVIRGDDAVAHTLRLTSGTNTWNISAKNAGVVNEDTVNELSFSGISNIVGASASDSLRTSVTNDADWSITAANKGTLTEIVTVNGVSMREQLIAFDTIGNLVGSEVNDTFSFSMGSSIVSAKGGDGTDTADLSALAPRTIIVGSGLEFAFTGVEVLKADLDKNFILTTSSAATWTIDNSSALSDGTVQGVQFKGFKTLQGSSEKDTFDIQTDFAGITIQGMNGGDVFNIRSAASGNIEGGAGADEFNIMANFTGKIKGDDGNDIFIFHDNGKVVDATGGDGDDLVDISKLTEEQKILVDGTKVHGVDNIYSITSGTSTVNHSLEALSGTNSWIITAENGGVVNDIQFINFKNIIGGAGDDTFTVRGAGASIKSIDGGEGDGVNTLVGRDSANKWGITERNAGTVSELDGETYVSFKNIQNLTGGADIDEFIVNAAIGELRGKGGNDVFKFNSEENKGSAALIDGGDDNDNDEIIGRRKENTWLIKDTTSSVSVTGGSVYITKFLGIDKLVGGDGADTFDIRANIKNGIEAGNGDNIFRVRTTVNNLLGGTGDDQFIFFAGGSAQSVDGGGGTNNSITGSDSENTWTITAPSEGEISIDGAAYVQRFSRIHTLNGGSKRDTFYVNAKIDNIFGKGGDDVFSFGSSGVANLISGGDGNNELSGRNQNSIWIMSGANAGSVSTSASPYVQSFNGIAKLVGNAESDQLQTNVLGNTWSVEDVNSGKLYATDTPTASIDFVGMENLLGNEGVDKFVFELNGDVTGLIDGGTTEFKDRNEDIVDLSLRTDGVTVQLGRYSTDALNIVNVEIINAAKEFNNKPVINKLTGASDSDYQWNINGEDKGFIQRITIDETTGKDIADMQLETTVSFTNFNEIVGGSKKDYFKVDSGKIARSIDGGDDIDFIDYSTRTGKFEIELGGSEDFGNTRVFGIEGIRGNSETNSPGSTIKVNSGSNWLIGSVGSADGINDGSVKVNGNTVTFENFTNIIGGAGNDNFIYLTNGKWIGTIDGAGGDNTIDAAASTFDQHFALNGIATDPGTKLVGIKSLTGNAATNSKLTSASRENTWQVGRNINETFVSGLNFWNIANLQGGSFNDTFNIYNIDWLKGVVDGGGGSLDKVNLMGLNSPITVSVDGVTKANLIFINVESIDANNVGNTLIGDIINSRWNIEKENEGFLTGTDATSGKIRFKGFANLLGSTADDVVKFIGKDAFITGHMDMRDGQDHLDLKDANRNHTVQINSAGGDIAIGNLSISNIEKVDGAKNASNSLNRLVADDYDNIWLIDAANSGRVTFEEKIVAFNGFENLSGGNQNDLFMFEVSGKVDGLVDGGAHESIDTIDLSKSNNSNVVIASTGDSLGFINIEKYIGNNTTSIFTGANILNNWVLSGTNSGVLNNTIQFENFAELKGGSAQDNFKIDNAIISGSIDGGDGNDTFDIRASAIAGKIKAGNGDDRFTFTILSDAEGIATIEGGDGENRLMVEGGDAAYRAVHQPGELEYVSANNNIYTISYTGFANIFDNVLADQLSIFGTSSPDIFRLQTARYTTNNLATVNYTNKASLIINGSPDDRAIVDGTVNVESTVTFNNLQLLAENAGKIQARSLEFVNTGDIGSSTSRLNTAVTDLSLTATNGKIFLDEQDGLTLKNFNVSTTDLIDIKAGGNLSSSGTLFYNGVFNLESLRGNIDLGNNNSLTGLLNLRANSNISLGNTPSLTIGDLFAQNANLSTGGSIKGAGVFNVGGLTTLAAGTDISLLNVANDINQFAVSNADKVEVFDKNGFTSTGITAASNVNLRSLGNINIGTACVTDCANIYGVNTRDLKIESDASVTITKNILTENIDIQSQAITVNDSITSKQYLLNAGSGKILLNEGGNLLGQGGAGISFRASSIDQHSNVISDGDINIVSTDDVVMSERATVESISGDVAFNSRNLQLATVKAVNGVATMDIRGAITDGNGGAINVIANRWQADALNGIGSGLGKTGDADAIETDVSILSVRNAGRLEPTMAASSINIANTDSIIIEQLRNNGDIGFSTQTGEIVLDNTNNDIYDPTLTDARLQGGVINTNAGLFSRLQLNSGEGMVRAENKANKKNPDIISDIASFTLNQAYDFGERNRRVVMHIPEAYAQIARFSYVAWYLAKPKIVADLSQVPPDSLISGSDQLIQIEGLSEIDPAVFTSLRNYLHDEIAILLPLDQRFDEEDDAF